MLEQEVEKRFPLFFCSQQVNGKVDAEALFSEKVAGMRPRSEAGFSAFPLLRRSLPRVVKC